MKTTRRRSFRVMRGSSSKPLPCAVAPSMQFDTRTPMAREPEFLPTRYSKLNSDGSGRHAVKSDLPKEPPSATRTQSAVEITLFVVFAVLFVLAAVALYTSYYFAYYSIVPNTVDAGLKLDHVLST